MRALFDDIALIDHQDEIGVANGGSRCAMTNEVLPRMRLSMARWMRDSVRVSTDDVASSRMSMRRSARRARAMVRS